MEQRAFFAASRLLIVAGKGGVGKTTVAAATVRAAAATGLRVLAVAVDPGTNLGALLSASEPLQDRDLVIATGLGPDGTGSITARAIGAGTALADYLEDHGLTRLVGRLLRNGVLDVVATAAPGIDDLLVLGKVKQLERSGAFDLIVLDAPAAGHAITFLQAASGLADVVKVGPIAAQATDVLAMLSDEARCRVILVTLAEETPVNELVEIAFALEDRIGVALGPVVVNALEPDRAVLASPPATVTGWDELSAGDAEALAAAATFRRARAAGQAEQLARLSSSLPLPQIALSFRFVAGLDATEIETLASELGVAIGALA